MVNRRFPFVILFLQLGTLSRKMDWSVLLRSRWRGFLRCFNIFTPMVGFELPRLELQSIWHFHESLTLKIGCIVICVLNFIPRSTPLYIYLFSLLELICYTLYFIPGPVVIKLLYSWFIKNCLPLVLHIFSMYGGSNRYDFRTLVYFAGIRLWVSDTLSTSVNSNFTL